MRKLRVIALALAICSLLFIVSGCKKKPQTPVSGPGDVIPDVPDTPDEPDTPTTPDEPDTPVTPDTPDVPDTPDEPAQPDVPVTPVDPVVYPYANPLTGEGLNEDISQNRPYAVMINNLTVALPQYGVGAADIIYEVLAEGGITRMMALYQDVSKVGTIGSIRSARPYYIDLARGHDAVYIHAGGSPDAYTMISNGLIASVDGTKGGMSLKVFYRDQNRIQSAGLEHSMFTSGSRLVENVSTAKSIRHEHYDGYAYTQNFVADATPAGGFDAPLIRAFFTKSKKTSFQYDESKELYGVYEYGSTYIDGNDGAQVFVPNVLCLFTDVSAIPGDTAGRLEVRTTGTGTGYYACGGKAMEILWSRAEPDDPMVYTLKDGTPLDMQVGSSYVCVLPKKASVTFVP